MPTPAAGFNIFAGTSGDFQCAIVGVITNTDMINTTSPPSPTSVLELTKWDFGDDVAGAEWVGFGAVADALGVLGKELPQGGISDWSVDLEGAYNGDSGASASTYARLKRGTFVHFNLIYHKASGLGFRGCFGKVVSFGGGSDAEGQKASPVRIKIKGLRLLPVPSFAP